LEPNHQYRIRGGSQGTLLKLQEAMMKVGGITLSSPVTSIKLASKETNYTLVTTSESLLLRTKFVLITGPPAMVRREKRQGREGGREGGRKRGGGLYV
jgi:hypothetical protein